MSRLSERPGTSELRLTRDFETTTEVLFDCFTRPELVVRWWGPQGTTCPNAESDLRVGGRYRYEILSEESGTLSVATGEFLEIQRPHRLVFSWHWEDAPHEVTRVTLLFRALDVGRAELQLIHQQFPSSERARLHDDGWTSSLRKLGDLIENLIGRRKS